MIYTTKKYHAFKRFVGNNIRIHREDNNLSQEQLAELSKLKPINIRILESGTHTPDFNRIFRIACALGLEPYMLLDNINGKDESGKQVFVSEFSIMN